MSVKLLFLDDSEERIKEAEKFFGEYWKDVTVARTAEEAIIRLHATTFHVVCLDHDLGQEVFQDSSRVDCGMEVVRWIEKNLPVIEHILVHTWNYDAGKIMTSKLIAAGYAVTRMPFMGSIFGGLESEMERINEENTIGDKL